MRPFRIVHVNLSVRDADATPAFWREVMGLEPIARPGAAPGTGSWFRLGEIELHLTVEPHVDNGGTRHQVALEVEDLEGWRARLVKGGAPIEPASPLPGVRRFFTRGPSGNRIEMCEPVAP